MRGAIKQRELGRRGAGRFALIAAVLLLFAQSVAVAHYHPRLNGEHPSLTTVVSAETGPCALCLFACHFPVSASAAPAMMQPQAADRVALAPSLGRAHTSGRSPAQTRAPPSVAL
jgi:hypothetical protein